MKKRWNPLQVSAGIFLLILVLAALAGPYLTPHSPNRQDLRNTLRPPMYTTAEEVPKTFILGTDYLGRDVLSRVISGARTSLIIGITTVIIASILGSVIGAIAGYFGGYADIVLSYITDVQLSIPFLVLALTMASIVKPSVVNIIAILAITSWPIFARIARSLTKSITGTEFLEAAEALGAGKARILLRHIAPNLFGTIAALATVEIAKAILAESALSFLGLGVPSGTPSWGYMTAEGRDLISVAWWVSTFPGIAILLSVVSISIFGDYAQEQNKSIGG